MNTVIQSDVNNQSMLEADSLDIEGVLCQTRLDYLCKDVLGFKDWDACHDDLAYFLDHSYKQKKLILMPREHLKSSIVTVGKSIQHLLQNPNTTILIANESQGNAEKFLREIKDYLTTKSPLPHIFGKFESTKWNEAEIIIKQKKSSDRASSVAVCGVANSVTSSHFDIIFLDDIVSEKTITTPEQFEKTRSFYSNTLDLLKKPGGILYVIGTRWDDADLYGTILEEWSDEFDTYVVGATKDGDIEGEPIFKKKFTTDVLKELLKQKGSYSFYSQYFNNPVSRETCHFKPPVRYWSEIPDKCVETITVDLAITEKTEGDYTVITRCGRVKDAGQLFVLEYERGHFDPSVTIKKICEMASRCKNADRVKVGVESVAFQKVMCFLLEDEKKRRGMTFQIEELHPHASKFARIIALQQIWESGNLLLKQGMIELEDEFARFPRGKHDDILDSLAMQIIMPDGLVGRSRLRGYVPPKFRRDFIGHSMQSY